MRVGQRLFDLLTLLSGDDDSLLNGQGLGSSRHCGGEALFRGFFFRFGKEGLGASQANGLADKLLSVGLGKLRLS